MNSVQRYYRFTLFGQSILKTASIYTISIPQQPMELTVIMLLLHFLDQPHTVPGIILCDTFSTFGVTLGSIVAVTELPIYRRSHEMSMVIAGVKFQGALYCSQCRIGLTCFSPTDSGLQPGVCRQQRAFTSLL